jgi:predicted CXXCH cytochrome family protein
MPDIRWGVGTWRTTRRKLFPQKSPYYPMLMKTAKIIELSIFLICLLLSPGMSAHQVFADQNSPCLTCHQEYSKPSKYDHGALSIGCNTCHVPVEGKKHPEQKNSISLLKDMPLLCYNCHKKAKFQAKYVHLPTAQGNCTCCHNPHRSRLNNLLVSERPDLCYKCHDRTNFTKKNIHPVIIGRRCDCHNPHASEYPYFLETTINELCVSCHKAEETGRHVVSLQRGRIHPVGRVPEPRNPKKLISCTTCHDPHSSNFSKLFQKKKMCHYCHRY